MAKNYIVEKLFWHEGFKCAVVLTSMGHRCGYVGVEPDHPFYMLEYDTKIKSCTLNKCAMTDDIGKRGLIDIICWDGSEDEISPCMLINVHGGITYSGGTRTFPLNQIDPIWWFGFDCAHLDDGKDWNAVAKVFHPATWKTTKEIEEKYSFCGSNDIIRTCDYVEQECRNLANALGSVYLIGDNVA